MSRVLSAASNGTLAVEPIGSDRARLNSDRGYSFFDLRGLWLGLATIVFWFPVLVAWNFIFPRIVPPRLEAYVPKETPSAKAKSDDTGSSSDSDLFHH